MSFWDTSALVPLCLNEDRSQSARRLWRRFPDRFVWHGSSVEILSALARIEREGVFTQAQRIGAEKRFERIESGWNTVESVTKMVELARTFPATHGLRALDSLQLAAALVWYKEFPKNKVFIAADEKLLKAAGDSGFRVIGIV